MSNYGRFNDQFRETQEERNDRLRERRQARHIETLRKLIVDLSDNLTDEGTAYSVDGLAEMRRRCANALPPSLCPDWLNRYRDPPMVQS